MPGHCVPRILPLSLYNIHCVQYIYIIFIYIYIYIYILYILYYLILSNIIYIYIRLYYTNVLTQLPRYQLFAFSHYSKRTPKVLPGPGHPGDTLLVISNWNHLECLTWKLSCLIAFHQYTNDIFLRIH